MARIQSPAEVQYLALEGGGGKGVTYLGAIRALERLGVLPIKVGSPNGNQIKGISGSSAGAITAMFLAMGYTSGDIERMLSASSTFTDFFDAPQPGKWRCVDWNNCPTEQYSPSIGVPLLEVLQVFEARAVPLVAAVRELLKLIAQRTKLAPSHHPLTRLLTFPEEYLQNLLFDRGLFPGFTVRKFLQDRLYDGSWQGKKAPQGTQGSQANSAKKYAEINFEKFYVLTGVDLVVTGANVSKHKPAVFSRRHTPLFPVHEAVAISMNLPLLFKPVEVQASVRPRSDLDTRADDYQGLWVDGGMLNNFPLHAFDFAQAKAGQTLLHPKMLGLRLTEPRRPRASGAVRIDPFETLVNHVSELVGTLLYPSEEGQIRSSVEKEQTIDLCTYDLMTIDFAPPSSVSAKPIAEAERAVDSYFASSTPARRRAVG